MTIFNKLNEYVTPHALTLTKASTGNHADKAQLLAMFYPILAAHLVQFDKLTQLADLTGAGCGADAVTAIIFGDQTWQDLVASLSEKFGLPTDSVASLMQAATPLALVKITELTDKQGLLVALTGLTAVIPAWAAALLPAGALSGGPTLVHQLKKAGSLSPLATTPVAVPVAASASPVAAAPVSHVSTAPVVAARGGFLKSLLPILGLLIFGGLALLLVRSCQNKPTPVAAPVIQQDHLTKPALIDLALDDSGKKLNRCLTQVGSESLAINVRAALAPLFDTQTCQFQVVGDYSASMPAGQYLPDLVGLIKDVPNASLGLVDKSVRFGGADEQTLLALVEKARALLPQDFDVQAGNPQEFLAALVSDQSRDQEIFDSAKLSEKQPEHQDSTADQTQIKDISPDQQTKEATAVSQPVDEALVADRGNQTAKQALMSLADEAGGEELIAALNLQIINFATGSSQIPIQNQEILDLAAQKLLKSPNINLKITGHTDSQGSQALNKQLSQARAVAVRDYLIDKGVPKDRLQALGVGSDQPIASNDDAQGRFKNRRIEFGLLKQ